MGEVGEGAIERKRKENSTVDQVGSENKIKVNVFARTIRVP
jgi:hypothetical protein